MTDLKRNDGEGQAPTTKASDLDLGKPQTLTKRRNTGGVAESNHASAKKNVRQTPAVIPQVEKGSYQESPTYTWGLGKTESSLPGLTT